MQQWHHHARRALRNPFFRVGLPMLVLATASFAGLVRFVEGKKELESAAVGKRTLTQRAFDLEEEHKRIMAKFGAHDYGLVPIQRPASEGGGAGPSSPSSSSSSS